ncbi:MAG: serine/threonine protein kinase [Bacteroidales bacterium]|nr:serine/threonine protein kinase [Bacteroidales bacterium]
MSDSEYISPAKHEQEEVLFDSGGTCDCYRLVKDNHIYCIKRPKMSMRNSKAYMDLFHKEFELGIELEHPNIVRYFAYDEDERGPYIRMDYVDGGTLEEFVAQHPDFFQDKGNRQQFLDELFSALSYLHGKNMLHLDLKPSNILITNKGHHVKLIDLGFGWSESYLHDVGFTRDYCAPEQQVAKTEEFGPATDIYALGKILQRFSLAEDAVVQRCLKDNPLDRYQSIGELQKAIKNNARIRMGSKVGLGLAAVLLIGAVIWLVGFREEPLPPRPPAPEGAISGLFTINEAGDQVYFSKGNLQYKPYTNTWRFAENQFDYVGGSNANVNHGNLYRAWLDLFSWSSNGRPHGSVNYQPCCFSAEEVYNDTTSQYSAYGIDTCDLCDHDGQADWGYNAISNGGNEEGLWRTLTIDEWMYLLYERNTASGIRFAKANVQSVNGLLLLPDDWDANVYYLSDVNDDEARFLSNSIPSSFWEKKVEVRGAVFLPAAGIRDVCAVGLVGINGYYWSATHFGNMWAKGIYFGNSDFQPEAPTSKYCARSVRLVKDK